MFKKAGQWHWVERAAQEQQLGVFWLLSYHQCLEWSLLTLDTQQICVIKLLSDVLHCGGSWKEQIVKGFINEEKICTLGLQGGWMESASDVEATSLRYRGEEELCTFKN